jgi:hypothetical protein
MKCSLIHIYKNAVIGTEPECATVTEILCDTGIQGYRDNDKGIFIDSYEIELEALKFISEKCKEKNYSDFDFEILIRKYSEIRFGVSKLEFNYSGALNTVSSMLVPNYREENLRSNDRFNSIISSKAADGASLFIINNRYMMYIYSGLLPINKSDKVTLDIYDVDNYSFLVKFIINKGKFTINKYVKYLYIN